jgi:hypothetical protein
MPNIFHKHPRAKDMENWKSLLKRHGYADIELDTENVNYQDSKLYEDGALGTKSVIDYGRVAFWKERGKDGIVVRPLLFDTCDGSLESVHEGTGIYLIGKAFDYLKCLGYDTTIKDHTDRIKVNDKEFQCKELLDGLDLPKFLEKHQRQHAGKKSR